VSRYIVALKSGQRPTAYPDFPTRSNAVKHNCRRRTLPKEETRSMLTTDPIVTFLLILVIGTVAGILFDRLAGPSWLARQFSGSTRGIFTSALVGVAGAFVGYHIAALLALGGGLVAELIAAAAGAAVVLLIWRMAK
jgi:uncharacterized membrane protein YeaQ/YmgE (transglycosylase-associated protein family)